MTRPGDVSGTMLRTEGLATEMLPVAGGSVAVAADVTVGESAVTADDDTAIIPS